MVYCAVVGCSSNNNNKCKNSSNSKFRYFSFPSSKEICELHFSEDDFQMKEKLLKLPLDKWKLRKDAIPSLNVPVQRKELLENAIDNRHVDEPKLESRNKTIRMDNAEVDTMAEVHSVTTRRSIATQTTSSTEQSELLERIRILEDQNKSLAEQLQKEKSERLLVERIFTDGQLRKLKTQKQIHWSSEDVAAAISLYAGGPRSYRLLKKRGYPLPSISTLRRWASKINVQPGVLSIVFTLMKDTILSRMERSCILLFDEMKVQSSYEYDKKSDTILSPSKYVQVVMARGICANWKQPIFYDYDCKITKNLLYKIITKLESIGYPVYAINCDLGSSNRGLWNSLNISEENTYFRNPVTDKRVHVFADAPHMVKLMRNHFLDSGFLLNGKIINCQPLVELMQKTQQSDLNIAHKLTSDLLTVKGAQRQKVKLATKLFSHTISRAVSRLGMLGIYQAENNWMECAEMLKIVNDWFDIFNAQIPCRDSRNNIKAYGLARDEQNCMLEKMRKLIKDMRKIGGSSLLPFQKGILISIDSLKQLYLDMKEDFKINYLLTYHLNQDPLEGLFSIIRAIGGLHDHPTALQFKYRLRNYLMGRNDQIIPESANVVQEESNMAHNISAGGNNSVTLMNYSSSAEQDHDDLVSGQILCALNSEHESGATAASESEDAESQLEDLHWDGLENLAGFIAFKLRRTEKLGYIPDHTEKTFSWTNHLSEGGLQKPTEDFLTKCNELDHIFNTFNGNGLKIGKNFLKNLRHLTEEVELSDDAKNLFFRCKMYFRMRILNKSLITIANTRKRKINKILK